jgi:hypothetical protein
MDGTGWLIYAQDGPAGKAELLVAMPALHPSLHARRMAVIVFPCALRLWE